MAIYISHELSTLSLNKIGKQFGNRDHSTVIYAVKKIKERLVKSNEIKDDYDLVKLKLSNL
jgi:chromosomal replication initiator protein